MSRKKKPQTLPELYADKEEAEEELRKAKKKEKTHQSTETGRKRKRAYIVKY